MKQKVWVLLVVFILILSLPNLGHSQDKYKYVISPDTDIYFGHISLTEVQHDGKDPVVIREGEVLPEVAVLNFPIAPGDTIRTTESRRCEIQFDTGTIIRLDYDTELKVETILAQSLSSRNKITNLILNKGHLYVMYKRYVRREVFQIITPNAAVKMNHQAVALINAREDGATDIQVKEEKAYALYGPDEDNISEEKIKKLQKFTISKEHKVFLDQYKEDIDFELWNENINENFQELHEGESFIPMPIRRLPKAVFYFAQKYSNLYGEWVWHSLYGYVWRPFLNNYYPWGGWQPYIYGQWTNVNGQLFWVPEEPWGWVPYHLGIWMWSEKQGWLWIPGSAFAPAWVAWDFLMGYYTWRPWSLYDWYLYGSDFYGNYFSPRGAYDYRYSNVGYEGNVIADSKKGKKTLRTIRKEQLKKRKNSPYPIPKELKKVCNNVLSALKRGDERALSSLQKIPDQMVLVKKEDLNASKIQEKVIKGMEIPREKQIEFFSQGESNINHYRQAVNTYRRNNINALTRDIVTDKILKEKGTKTTKFVDNMSFSKPKDKVGMTLIEKLQPTRLKTTAFSEGKRSGAKSTLSKRTTTQPRRGDPASLKPSRSTMRFRDWNPDMKAARRAGVSIKYSSKANEVRCPELKISSSRMVNYSKSYGSRVRLGSSGVVSYSGSGSSSGSSRGAGSSGSRSSGSSSGRSSSGEAKKK